MGLSSVAGVTSAEIEFSPMKLSRVPVHTGTTTLKTDTEMFDND
jgi:hypothetical protein